MKLESIYYHSTRNQYIAVLIVNIVSLCQGSNAGWISPALLILGSKDTPLGSGPLSVEEISWLASAFAIGAFFGVIISGFTVCRIGNKGALIFMAIPQIIWWCLVAFANEYCSLVIGRAFVGFTSGCVFRIIPKYVADVAEKDIRGILGSISGLALDAGNFIGFVLGSYVPYKQQPWAVFVPVFYIFIILFVIPETPPHLISKGKKEEAFESLLFYRSVNSKTPLSQCVQEEFNDMEKLNEVLLTQEKKFSWRAYCTKEATFGLGMAIFLVIFGQCTGLFLLMQFTAPIFRESGSNLDANDSAIIVSSMLIIGNVILILLVDRVGRKILLMTCTIGASISLTAFGIYCYLNDIIPDGSSYEWIPIFTFSLTVLLLTIGVSSIPFVLLTEILPPEIRDSGLTIANVGIPVIRFVLLKEFPALMEAIQVSGIMWLFAGCCVFGVIVCGIFLPETKGRNLNRAGSSTETLCSV